MAFPCFHSQSNTVSAVQGQGNELGYVLQTVGRFMAFSQQTVKALIFDAHGSHQMLRRILHGCPTGTDPSDLKDIPFFGSLEFEEVWENVLPRMPIKLCKYEGDYVYAIPGICYWM